MSTIVTILLFKALSTQDFSIWANIYSAIFLTLLWLDFGFKKSLPRYCPQFILGTKSMYTFIKRVVLFQATTLILFTPIFLLVSQYVTRACNITDKINLFYLGCLLFLSEGVIAVIRLIYHSYFWQKQFNSLMSILVILKSLIIIFFIFVTSHSFSLVTIIFITEIISALIAIVISIIMLKVSLGSVKEEISSHSKTITQKNLGKAFVFHSAIMWINNNVKSLSERNFMMLFFTHLLGPLQANLFKLANDCALLFQRIIVKTIGTTDTSLLSHIEISHKNKTYMPHAFENLIKSISFLFVPLIGILFPLLIYFNNIFKNQFVFMLFFLLTICYLIETILHPYERLLEVKRKYMLLFISYSPYVLTLTLLLLFHATIYKNIIFLLTFIYVSRIGSYLIMLYITRKKYGIVFPIKPVSKTLTASLLLCLTIYFALKMLYP